MTRRITAIFILLSIVGLLLFAFAQYMTYHPLPAPIIVESSSYPEIDESKFTIEIEIEPIKSFSIESSESSEEPNPKQKSKTQTKTQPADSSSESSIAEEIIQNDDLARKYIGRCRLTIYTPTESHWGYSTATGVKSQHLATCAVDPKVIPYGSTVILIDKNGDEHHLLAVDCGNFKGKMIDVFYEGSVKEGVSYLVSTFGAEYAEVWIER